MRKFFICTFLSLPLLSIAQAPPEYSRLAKQADSLYKLHDYKKSALAYSAAFKTFGWKGYLEDRYNAACSWALASVPDSAFSNLNRLAMKANYSNYRHVSTDTDLQSLHTDPRWTTLLKLVKENKDKMEATFDTKLIALLDSMFTEDQKWRHMLTNFNNKQLEADNKMSRQEIERMVRKTDSLGYYRLKDIFAKYGYPNYDLVGEQGSHSFWLLMQHEDEHPKFQEEVLAKMKVEADRGKASMIDYAYLLDRVKVNTGQPQVYGTQMTLNADKTSYQPKPVIEPEKLDERRKSVGLGTIESYIQSMNSRYFGTLKKK